MRIIICGAGQVGSSIANHLSEEGYEIVDHELVLWVKKR